MIWPEKWLLAGSALAAPAAAAASETVTYTYDVFGRLTAVSTQGGPGDGTAVSTAYDPAGNRTSYGVAGAGPAGAAALTAPASGSTSDAPAPSEGATAQPAAGDAPLVNGIPQEEEPDGDGGPAGGAEGGTPERGR